MASLGTVARSAVTYLRWRQEEGWCAGQHCELQPPQECELAFISSRVVYMQHMPERCANDEHIWQHLATVPAMNTQHRISQQIVCWKEHSVL